MTSRAESPLNRDAVLQNEPCQAGVQCRRPAAGLDLLSIAMRPYHVTNLSTGYCPEPSCWPAVAEALDVAMIRHDGSFTEAFHFRRCPACGERNVLKDGAIACDADLPLRWNLRA
jgi:hypothetical protein